MPYTDTTILVKRFVYKAIDGSDRRLRTFDMVRIEGGEKYTGVWSTEAMPDYRCRRGLQYGFEIGPAELAETRWKGQAPPSVKNPKFSEQS